MIICSWFLLFAIPGISFTIAQKATVLKETCQVFTFRFKFFIDPRTDIGTVETIEKPADASIKKLMAFISESPDCSKTKQHFHKHEYTKTSGTELTALLSFIINPLDNSTDRTATPLLCSNAVNLRLGEQARLTESLPLDIFGTIKKAQIVRAQTVSCCEIFYGYLGKINSCCKTDFIEDLGKCTCPSGKFLDTNRTECEPCPEDTYEPESGSSKCKPCSNGTTTYTSTGATSAAACRQACLPGERFNLVSKNCTQCPRNTYQPLLGQLKCVLCPNNTITNNTGNDRLDDCVQSCSPGSFYNFPSASCKSCPRNFYQQTAGQFQCNPCNKSGITLKNGSNSEQDCILECQQGTFYDFSTTICQPCPLNQYQKLLGQLNCTQCPNNTITINVSSTTVQDCIKNCSLGSAYNYTTQDCQKCPRNFFQSQTGKTKCTLCPDGKITNTTGTKFPTSCFEECKKGHFYDFDTAKCHPCPLRYYQNIVGQLSCIRCPNDTITINVSSITVQDCITNCTSGSAFNYTTQDCQKCPLNFFQSQSGKTTCTPCPKGKITSSPGARFPNSCFKECDAGMTYNADSLECDFCPSKTYKPTRGETKCITCPEGKITYKQNNTKETDCAEECQRGSFYNKTLQKCILCPRGKYQPSTGQVECKKCASVLTTYQLGSVDDSMCNVGCSPGKYLNTTTRSCESCPPSTYQDLSDTTACKPCPNNKTTLNKGTKVQGNCVSLKSTSSPQIDVIEIVTIGIPAAGTIVVIVIVIICFLQRKKTIKSNDPRRMSAGVLEANSSFTDSSPSFVRPKLDSDVSMANHHYKMEGSGLKPDVLRPNSRTVNVPKGLEIPRENLIFVGEVLGKGNFGRVEKARLLKDGEETIVAVKMIKGGGSFSDEKELFDELEILASLYPHPHPNIVNLVGGSTFDDGPLFVAVEYCANGNLLKYLQRNQTRSKPKAEYVNILPKAPKPTIEYHWKLNKVLAICSGMVHLAKYKVVHRDVAARNVLLDVNWVAKISDFGMARDIYVQHIYRKDTEGFLPVRWMAIESLESFIYTSQSDVWSFGILMWEIITDGRVPYNNIFDHNQLLNYIKSGRIMKRPKNCPKDYYNIMEKCWGKDPSTRPKFESLAREIQIIYDNELRKNEALPQRIFRKFSSRRKRKKPEGEDESKDGGLASGKLRPQNTMGNSPSKKIDKIEEEHLFTDEVSPGKNTMSMQVLETPKHDQTFQEELDNKGYDSGGSGTAPNSPHVLETELSEGVEVNEKASSEMDNSKYPTDPDYKSSKLLSQNRKESCSEQKSEESETGNDAKDGVFLAVGRETVNAELENIDDSPSNLVSDLELVAKDDTLVHDSNTPPTRDSEVKFEESSSLATDTKTEISESLAADDSNDALGDDKNNQVN